MYISDIYAWGGGVQFLPLQFSFHFLDSCSYGDRGKHRCGRALTYRTRWLSTALPLSLARCHIMDPTVTRQRAGALNLWRFAVLLGATFRQTAVKEILSLVSNCRANVGKERKVPRQQRIEEQKDSGSSFFISIPLSFSVLFLFPSRSCTNKREKTGKNER